MSKVYKIPGDNNLSDGQRKSRMTWKRLNGRELVLFIKDELRKTWLAALDSAVQSGQLKCGYYILHMILTFLICLPPSDPGLPETKWNSISGWSRLLLVNLVDTQARPWNDSELVNIFILIVNFIVMGVLNNEGIVCQAAKLAMIKSCNKTILMLPNVCTLSWSLSAAFGECKDAMSQGTVVMNQCGVRCGPLMSPSQLRFERLSWVHQNQV